MEIIYRGAESIIYLDDFEGQKVLVKERIKKKYRLEKIDEKLRKEKNAKKAKLLNEARRRGIYTPQILNVDKMNNKIIMERIDGRRIKDFLNDCDKKEIKEIMFETGRSVGKLHSQGIVHGDLTTSNLIWNDGKVYFIDFGLGDSSKRIEDQGVDLKLFYEALKSTHFK